MSDILLTMKNTTSLSDKDIDEIYKLMGIVNEEKRQEILKKFYIKEEDSVCLRVKGDNVTTV